MPKLDLRDVALVAVDSANLTLTARALELCLDAADFADAVLVSDAPVAGRFRPMKIERLATRADYSAFLLQRLPDVSAAPFVLVVQWDGYIVDPSAWRGEFRDYDYIGARWPWHIDKPSVGNGGFSLRSRKLCLALRDPSFSAPAEMNEDEFICHQARGALEEKHGICFAPESVADQFAYERVLPLAPTFGFHGLFNMWRHITDSEMTTLAEPIAAYARDTAQYMEITFQYFLMRKFGPLRAFYSHLRAAHAPGVLQTQLGKMVANEDIAAKCIALCEDLLRR